MPVANRGAMIKLLATVEAPMIPKLDFRQVIPDPAKT